MRLKEKDCKIIVELRKNARAQLTEISKNTKIPISTIYDKLKNNTKGIIKKYVSLLDYELIGFNARATICIKCSKNSKIALFEMLSKHQNVNSLYKINNGYDYMVEVIFKNIKELEEFVEEIEDHFTIKSKEIYYIIDEIKKENFLNNQEYMKILNI